MIVLTKHARDLAGQVFGRLTAIEPVGRARSGSVVWRCVCVCGKTHAVTAGSLRSGKTTSCGCAKGRRPTHGHTRTGRTSREYRSWRAMKARCFYPADPCYADYGGRGITVCDAWVNSFETFLADMGPRPEGTSLERVDNSKGYGPENCVWATPTQQNRNQRRNRLLEFNGRTQCLTAWAEERGLTRYVIAARLKRGLSISQALTP